MSERRPVRVDLRFGEERGPNGEPSRIDFLRFELPALEDEFALRFEELPEVIPGRPDYRQVITAGRLVPFIAIVGQLSRASRRSNNGGHNRSPSEPHLHAPGASPRSTASST